MTNLHRLFETVVKRGVKYPFIYLFIYLYIYMRMLYSYISTVL